MENIFVVTPMNQTMDLVPGESHSGSITVLNPADSKDDLVFDASVSPYSVVGEEYDIDLVTMSNYSMIAKWIRIDKPSGTLKPGESKEINFTINVPDSAPSGGQYVAILVSGKAKTEENETAIVNNIYEIASIVYSTVAGKTKHEGEILENNIPSFVMDTPAKVSSSLINAGNIHEVAIINLDIKNIITGETIISSEQNTGHHSEVIMPETVRDIEYTIANLPVVGIVKISQNIYYNGNFSTQSRDVLICPIWFIVLVFVIFSSVVCLFVKIIKKRRHRKVTI